MRIGYTLRGLLLACLLLITAGWTGCRTASTGGLPPASYVSGIVGALDAGYLIALQQRVSAQAEGNVGACVAASFAVGLLPVGSELLVAALDDGAIKAIPAWTVDATSCGVARPEGLPDLTLVQAYVSLAFTGLSRQLTIWQATLQAEACGTYSMLRTLLDVSNTLAARVLIAIETWELSISNGPTDITFNECN